MKIRSCLSLAVLCLVGCTDKSTSPPAANETLPASASTAAAQADEAQSFGDFSFSVPKGWSVVAPDQNKTKAMLLLDGTDWQNAKAMIKIDVGAPAAPTAKQLAEGFASSTGGSVSDDAIDVDGTPAISASTTSTELTTPRNMIVIYRDSKVYLLMAGATAGVDIDDALSHIRDTWKWTSSAE